MKYYSMRGGIDTAYSLQLAFARTTFPPSTRALSSHLSFVIFSSSLRNISYFSGARLSRGGLQSVCKIYFLTLHNIARKRSLPLSCPYTLNYGQQSNEVTANYLNCHFRNVGGQFGNYKVT